MKVSNPEKQLAKTGITRQHVADMIEQAHAAGFSTESPVIGIRLLWPELVDFVADVREEVLPQLQ